jgi:hypothetical protein
VSLAGVEAPYLLSAYRKPVYVYFTSLDGLASSVSTSAVMRYAVSEYGDAYSQYTASNRTFKFEAIERPADWFFRVSPVRRFYEYLQPVDVFTLSRALGITAGAYENTASEYRVLLASRTYSIYERLYEGPSYSKSISPLLTSYIFAYRPRRRYASYTVSDYSQLYSLLNYIKSVLFRAADLENLYGVPLYKKLSYSFISTEDVLAVALGTKPVYVSLIDSEPVFDSSTYRLASRVFTEYASPVDRFTYVKSTSPVLIVQVLTYRPRRRYASFATSDYAWVYEGVKAVKSVVFIVSGLENVYGIPSYVKLSYVFDVISDVLTSVIGVKPIYAQISAVEQDVDLASYRLASKAYNTYERLYERFAYSKTVSSFLTFQILTYRPRRRYVSYGMSDYSVVYNAVKYGKAVALRIQSLEDLYSALSYRLASFKSIEYISPIIRFSYSKFIAVSSYSAVYSSADYVKSISPILAVRSAAYRPMYMFESFSVSEFYLPYESSAVKTPPVYSVESYEGLYEPVYRPTVRYYNTYFVNTYRYSNIYDLERPYESIKYEKKSAGFSFASYEGLYEGFIAQRG